MIAALVLSLFLSGCTDLSTPSDEKSARPVITPPNIVMVMADDLSPNLVPYLDEVQRLQDDGVTMRNHFVVNSLCCPSRAAIFTGEYPHNNGVLTNTPPNGGARGFRTKGNEKKSFALTLQQQGYRTGLMGKYLNGYRVKDDPPPGWDDWQVGGDAYASFNYRLNNNGKIQRYGSKPQDHLTDVLSRKANQFVADSADQGQPFFLMVTTFAPHRPTVPAPRHAKLFPRLKAPRGPAYNRLPKNAPQWATKLPKLTKEDQKFIDDRFRGRVRAAQAVDELLGSLRAELRAQGLDRNTYVIFTSDNSYHLGDRQLLAGKQTPYDVDTRVPLFVAGPDVPAGTTVKGLTSTIDFAPTFAEIAGADEVKRVDGSSMLDYWHGSQPTQARQAVLIEHVTDNTAKFTDPDYQTSRGGDPPNYFALRTDDALYVRYGRSPLKPRPKPQPPKPGEPRQRPDADVAEEYYDLTRDRDQLVNRAGSAPDRVLDPLRDQLKDLVACNGSDECQRAARQDR